MAQAKSYKTRVKPKGQPEEAWLDCDSRFATKDEGDALAKLLGSQLGDNFETDCVECDDAVTARMTSAGPIPTAKRAAGGEWKAESPAHWIRSSSNLAGGS